MSSTEVVDEIAAQNVAFIHNLVNTEKTLESPIDLDISYMKVIELRDLEWTDINVIPRKLKMTNTGYTVILSAKWQREQRPYLSGGPFTGNYGFAQIHFHWGENDMNGSEHSVDGSRLPMELHVVHFKNEYDTLESALRRPDGVTVIVYFCKLQEEPNESMHDIIKQLSDIREAHSSVRIVPMDLRNIIKPFTQDYFLYWGSIITVINVHRILWMVCREPIGLSVGQVAEFRNLTDEREAPILSNIRPLKERQERSIFHVCPSGSLYASLLPIPRIVTPRHGDGVLNPQNVSAA